MSRLIHKFRTVMAAVVLCALPAFAAAQEAAPRSAPPRQPEPAHLFGPAQNRAPAPRPPVATPRAPQAARAPQAPPAPKPPREVVTIVHRLSGWKLLNWLATNGPPQLELDDLPTGFDVHTNIVAGFIHSDGRKVVARLPQGAAEWEFAPFQPPAGMLAGAGKNEQSEFTLLTHDGRRVRADFVGLDAATGLSVLEAAEPLIAYGGDEGHTEDPSVGQRVRLYAPAQVPAAPGARRPPAGGEGVIYLGIDRADGLLTAVTRAPSGRAFQVTARADGVTPAWTGAVATTETGSLVGIVSQSQTGETHIVSGEMVRQAVERVQTRRASVPQPWLGVRGDAAFRAPLDAWVGAGWKPETALPLIRSRQGVLLTSVPPGTPAAAAGLRPGDVIARVGGRDVHTAEDLSLMLKELHADSTVDFTVWRSFEPGPVRLPVLLRGARNPALSTAEAEARAARESLSALRARIRDASPEGQPSHAAGVVEPAALSESLRRAERQLDEAMSRMTEAEPHIAEAPPTAPEAPRAAHAPEANAPARPFQTYGAHVVGLTPRSAAGLGARGGVLVVSVRPESPLASAGLLPGDVVETVNGRPPTRLAFARLARDARAEALSLVVVRERRRLNVSFAP